MLKFISWLFNIPANYSSNDSKLTRFMGMTLFLFNMFLQLYSFISSKSFDYFIELVSINYAMILMLLGIKGYFETQKAKYHNGNSNGSNNSNSHTSTEPLSALSSQHSQ